MSGGKVSGGKCPGVHVLGVSVQGVHIRGWGWGGGCSVLSPCGFTVCKLQLELEVWTVSTSSPVHTRPLH